MNILEHSLTSFVSEFGFGLGSLGEQGTESNHKTIVKAKTRVFNNIIVKPAEKLKILLNAQQLQTTPSPTLQNAIFKAKKTRKRK